MTNDKNRKNDKAVSFESILKSEKVRDIIIKEAQELVEGRVSFTNDWDMERCAISYQVNMKKHCLSPNGDGEWVYQLSRMEYLHKLIMAFLISQNKIYLQKYSQWVGSFFKCNTPQKNGLRNEEKSLLKKIKNHIVMRLTKPENYRFPTYRTLDTAIRCYSLLVDQRLLQNCNDDYEFGFSYERRIIEDVMYTFSHLRKFDDTSNWGIIILSLGITCCLMLKRIELIKNAESRLVTMLKLQILEDGGHIECATMYHTQIMLALIRLIHWSDVYNYPIDSRIRTYAEKMVRYSYALSDPYGYQVQYGDSDYTSLNTVFLIAKRILTIPEIKIHTEIFDVNLLLEFPDTVFEYSIGTDSPNTVLLDSGVWAYNDAEYAIRAFNEVSNSAHKHADNGSIVLYYHDTPFLVDSGRFSYCATDKRKYFRGPKAHSIAVIDDGSEWKFKNQNLFSELPVIVSNNEDVRDGVPSFVCSYKFTSLDLMMNRRIYVVGDIVVIISSAEIPGEHLLGTFWNMTESSQLIMEEKNCILANIKGQKLYFSYSDVDLSVEDGLLSYHYNEECNNKVIYAESKMKDHGVQILVISPEKICIEGNQCSGYRIIKAGKAVCALEAMGNNLTKVESSTASDYQEGKMESSRIEG